MPPARDAQGNLIRYVPRAGVPRASALPADRLTPSGVFALPDEARDLSSALLLLNQIRALLIDAGLAVEKR
jgi:hypothetical protein